MRWSLQIARLAGIPIRVHVTFLFLVAWVAYATYVQDPDLNAVGSAVLFLLAVFGLIVMHELSHSLTARLFGIGTRDITLWPIGGISRLERMPEIPAQEFLIAIAGPLLNVILALTLGAYVVLTSGWEALLVLEFGQMAFLPALVWVNAALAGFNLLPAFPMDGGRALRAFLAMFMDRVQATRLAATTGKMMAVLFGLLGLLINPFLVVIAVFVWLGATAEAAHTEMTATLSGHAVSSAMTRRLEVLRIDDSLGAAARLLTSTGQGMLPVVSEGRAAGVLSELDLLRGLASEGPRGAVADFMSRNLPVEEPSASLVGAFRSLQERGVCCVLVEEDGRLVGVLTRPGVSSFLAVASALRGQVPPAEPPELQSKLAHANEDQSDLQRWADDGGVAATSDALKRHPTGSGQAS
jgi:Zn-dependent protease